MICCPNVIQGKHCNCGFNNFLNSNDSKDIAEQTQTKNHGSRDAFSGQDGSLGVKIDSVNNSGNSW